MRELCVYVGDSSLVYIYFRGIHSDLHVMGRLGSGLANRVCGPRGGSEYIKVGDKTFSLFRRLFLVLLVA